MKGGIRSAQSAYQQVKNGVKTAKLLVNNGITKFKAGITTVKQTVQTSLITLKSGITTVKNGLKAGINTLKSGVSAVKRQAEETIKRLKEEAKKLKNKVTGQGSPAQKQAQAQASTQKHQQSKQTAQDAEKDARKQPTPSSNQAATKAAIKAEDDKHKADVNKHLAEHPNEKPTTSQTVKQLKDDNKKDHDKHDPTKLNDGCFLVHRKFDNTLVTAYPKADVGIQRVVKKVCGDCGEELDKNPLKKSAESGNSLLNSQYAGHVFAAQNSPKLNPVTAAETMLSKETFDKYVKTKNGVQYVAVPFKETGYPDFAPFKHPIYPIVRITQTENRGRDFRDADKEVEKIIKEPFVRPEGWTWHHHEDTEQMILVPKDIHDSVKHSGGVEIVSARNKKNKPS